MKGKNKFFALILAAICGAGFAIIISFCVLPFWSLSRALQLIVLGGSFLLSASPCWHLINKLFTKTSSSKFRRKGAVLSLLLASIVSILIFQVLIEPNIQLPWQELKISLSAPDSNGSNIRLHIISAELESTKSPLTPISSCSSDNNGSFIADSACDITYLVPTGKQDNAVFTIDNANSNAILKFNLRYYSKIANLSKTTAESTVIPIDLSAKLYSRKILFPLYGVILLSLSIVLFSLIFLAAERKAKKTLMKSKFSNRFNWADLGIVSLFIAMALVFANGVYGSSMEIYMNLQSDAGNIASFVAARQFPANFVKDELLSDPENFGEYYAFHIPLISLLGKMTGSYTKAFLVLIIPVTLLQLIGYYLLGKKLFRDRLLALILSLATAVPIHLPLYEFFGFGSDILPRTLLQAILPFGLLLLVTLAEKPKYHLLLHSVLFLCFIFTL